MSHAPESPPALSVEASSEQLAQPARCALATGSDAFALQFLTSSGWQTDRVLESEGLAIAHFFAVGKANVWTGHVRIQHGERTVKSTLHPNTSDVARPQTEPK